MSSPANESLFNRPDTLFGVCEGIGREFGFHPNFLRVGFALFLVINPVAVIATYIALGIAVAMSRLLVPARRDTTAAAAPLAEVHTVAEEAEDQVALAA